MRRSETFRARLTEPIVICVIVGTDAWSTYLRDMTSRPDWSVARLARDAGIARSTIFRWIAEGAGRITIESVYMVADALGDSRANALRAAAGLGVLDRDEEIDLIMASEVSEALKARMIERLMQRRREERERRMADLRWMLEDRDADGDAGELAADVG